MSASACISASERCMRSACRRRRSSLRASVRCGEELVDAEAVLVLVHAQRGGERGQHAVLFVEHEAVGQRDRERSCEQALLPVVVELAGEGLGGVEPGALAARRGAYAVRTEASPSSASSSASSSSAATTPNSTRSRAPSSSLRKADISIGLTTAFRAPAARGPRWRGRRCVPAGAGACRRHRSVAATARRCRRPRRVGR